jgi:hypothetical protein
LGGADAIKKLRAAAVRLVAAECSAFLAAEEPHLLPERWDPYKAWAALVEPRDCVITFNYDLVLEKLIAAVPESKLLIVKPGQVNGMDDHAKVLKLHGSVNWDLDPGSGTIQVGEPDDFALRCDANHLCIASPGPSKAQKTACFADLWHLAAAELTRARRIVFIGYRMPPTDVRAADWILAAIATCAAYWKKALKPRRNRRTNATIPRQDLPPRIDLVLGEDRRSIERLRALLSGVGVQSDSIKDTRFYATDYMVVCHRGNEAS